MIKLSVDRIINNIAVCYDDDCRKYEIPSDGLSEGDIISAEFDENRKLITRHILKKETEKRRSELAERTRALFNKK